MPDYEREVMAGRVVSFYHHLPEHIMRPWEGNPDMFTHRDDVVSLLRNHDGQDGLLRHMDEAIAELPLDFPDYEKKVQILTDLHGYVEGTYTIFPEKKKEEVQIENGGQLSLFDFMVPEKTEEKKEETTKEPLKKAEPEIRNTEQAAEESGHGSTGKYGYGMGSFIYLDADHLYRIKG